MKAPGIEVSKRTSLINVNVLIVGLHLHHVITLTRKSGGHNTDKVQICPRLNSRHDYIQNMFARLA